MARERARLRETLIAEVAGKGAYVAVAPVVHDQARAFLENFVAVSKLAHKVRDHAIILQVHCFVALVRIWRHGLEACVGLSLSHVLPLRH